MKKLVSILVASVALISVSLPASADESTVSTQTSPGAITMKTITVYGRVDKPHVEIILTRATAASAAGAAHDGLHARLMGGGGEPRMTR
jgi:hypothetical protein